MIIDLDKIMKSISDEKISEDDIQVSDLWNSKYVNPELLSEKEVLSAIVHANNTLGCGYDIYPMTKKKIKKLLGWSFYKIAKVKKAIPEIVVVTMIDDEGLLAGKGYVLEIKYSK